MKHDPLCPFAKWPDEDCFQPDAGVRLCQLIRQVRRNERQHIINVIDAYVEDESKRYHAINWINREPLYRVPV